MADTDRNERWVKVRGYGGVYEVSDRGRVKRLSRRVLFSDGRVRVYPELLFSAPRNRSRYVKVSLKKSGGRFVSFYVHFLVAAAFLPKPNSEVEINHKDGDRSNNDIANLEWVTHQENMKHSIRTGLRRRFAGCCVSKVPDSAVLAMRERAARGEEIQYLAMQLASRWRVGVEYASKIIRRKVRNR